MTNQRIVPAWKPPVAPPRVAIVINLDDLRDLTQEFVKEVDPDNEDLLGWTFETFLQWLHKRQSKSDNEVNARR